MDLRLLSASTLALTALAGTAGAQQLFAGSGNSQPNPGSLLSLDPNTFAGTVVGASIVPGGMSGLAFDGNGRLWGSVSQGGGAGALLVELDPVGGTVLSTLPVLDATGGGVRIGDLATNPANGEIWGVGSFPTGGLGDICTIDTATGTATFIGNAGVGNDGGLAFTPDGRLWLVTASVGNPVFAELDPGTGLAISSVMLGPDVGLSGLASRPSDGALLATRGNFGGGDLIVMVDRTTGMTTQLGMTGVGNPADLAYAGDGFGSNYCSANPNSTGNIATISAAGSPFVAQNDVTLSTIDMPLNAFGFYLTSLTQGFTPNPGGSAGNLCLAGQIGRYVGAGQIQNSGATGEISLVLDLTMTPQPMGFVQVMPGETWNFTTWFRDSDPMGNATSNFSDGLEVSFL